MDDGGRGGAGSARERMGEIAGDVQDRLEGMRGYAEDAGEWIRALARERPWVAIAAAVGIGFVVGRLASRT